MSCLNRFSPALPRLAIALLAAAALAFDSSQASAALIVETWEAPALAPGASSTVLPAPWVRFSGPVSSSVVVYPDGGTFDQVGPLAGPAGENQALRLSGQNTGVYRLSGGLIQADTIYTLSAAIGNDLQSAVRNDSWSLQLWADANGNGIFDESPSAFIGQQYGTNVAGLLPVYAPDGEWALNSFTFDSATTPDLVGKELIVFLNNFLSDGTSYYDNVTLAIEAPTPAPVPEPASMLAWTGLAAGFWTFARKRRRQGSDSLDRSPAPSPERAKERPVLSLSLGYTFAFDAPAVNQASGCGRRLDPQKRDGTGCVGQVSAR